MTHEIKPLICAGCTKCCRGELVLIFPDRGDNPAMYQTVDVTHPLTGAPVLAIEPTADGACRYLGARGCSIYATRPLMCRAFDCADMFVKMGRHERRRRIKFGLATRDLLETGRAKAIERGMI